MESKLERKRRTLGPPAGKKARHRFRRRLEHACFRQVTFPARQ